jgi:hypothetical protein
MLLIAYFKHCNSSCCIHQKGVTRIYNQDPNIIIRGKKKKKKI